VGLSAIRKTFHSSEVQTVAPFAPRTLAAVVASVAFLVAPAVVKAGDGDPYKVVVATVPSAYWGYTYSPYASALHGVADVIRSQGDFLVKREQAISLRLDNRVKYLEVRKKEIEFVEWERDYRMEGLNRLKAQAKKVDLKWSLENATDTEIIHARPHNVLLDHLKKRTDLTAAGSVPLEEEWLKHAYTTGDNYSNLGLLANEKELQYRIPPLLLRPEFYGEIKEIERLLVEAKNVALLRQSQTLKGAEQLREVRQRVEECKAHVERENLKAKSNPSSRWSEFIAANRLLKDLDANVAALESPDAAFLVRPPEGKTVHELVTYMKKHELKFAKANNGDERFFRALYNALADEVRRLDGQPKNP
jgi:hypothetical protein